MTLHISSVFTYDEDAGNYIQAVETADGQALESATRKAINNFVIGCKQDGIWDAIKASCILAGARTLSGALVPLKGPAPTNDGPFVAGDYNRKTGLVGNASTKYLNSNRNNNADPQNSFSVGVWISSAGTPSDSTQLYLGNAASAMVSLGMGSSQLFSRNRSTSVSVFGTSTAVGFFGTNRSSSASYIARFSNANTTIDQVSQTPSASNIFIFTESTASAFLSNARLAFYSIGESLDLALLDSRVTDLITAIGAAIP